MSSASAIVESRWAITNVVRPSHRLAQRQLDRLLGRGVDGGGRVVEDEDARVGHERARDRDPLALAAGEREAALAHDGVVAVGQLGDEAGRLRALGGALDLLARRLRAAVGDVVVHGRAEQERVVGDDADLVPQRARSRSRARRRRRSARCPRSRRTGARSGSRASTCPRRCRPPAPPSCRRRPRGRCRAGSAARPHRRTRRRAAPRGRCRAGAAARPAPTAAAARGRAARTGAGPTRSRAGRS